VELEFLFGKTFMSVVLIFLTTVMKPLWNLCCTIRIYGTNSELCVYKAPSGKYSQFLKLFDMMKHYNPYTTELLMCLTNCYHQKQQLSLLLGTYRMFHMVNFPTRFRNKHASAADNIFLDLYGWHAYMILPLSRGLSDRDAV
jgi:hypothetical protein